MNSKSYKLLDFYIRNSLWVVVVAQLVERWLPTPEVHGSNPAIGKFYSYIHYQLFEKTK